MTTCRHYAFRRAKHWRCELEAAFAEQQETSPQAGVDWAVLINPLPPARRLSDQKSSGYPRWSDDQLARAYPPDVLPHLVTIFKPEMRSLNQDRLIPVLLPIAQPDMKLSLADRHHHWSDRYFCIEPRPALARLITFLTHLRDGTKRLRTIPPAEIICPVKSDRAPSGPEAAVE